MDLLADSWSVFALRQDPSQQPMCLLTSSILGEGPFKSRPRRFKLAPLQEPFGEGEAGCTVLGVHGQDR